MDGLLTLGPDGRVADVEGKTLEFKRDLSSPERPLRTIVVFANSAGGRLVIGVDDDGTVAGVADPLAEEERIASPVTGRISPQLVPALDLVTLGGRTVLVVDVPLSTRRPHCMTRQGPEAGVYVRLGSTTRQADPALVAELERIQVDSPGLLLPGMTVETMRRASRLRNPALARIFREAGIMEQRGTGVQRVFEQVAEVGLPEPVIEEIMDRVRVTVYVPSHDPAGRSRPVREAEGGPLSHQVEPSGEQVSKSSEQGAVLLRRAAAGPCSRAELLTAIGLSDAYGNYRRHLLPLVERGYLARTVPDKPNSRLQRYRLTDAGRAYLDASTTGEAG